MRKRIARVLDAMAHFYGRMSRKFYCEDFVRVYPNGTRINRFGWRKTATPTHAKNFLNHHKFYAFAAQFAHGNRVVDIGCGSGYGCALLKNAGATCVYGTDASRHAVRFAKNHYGDMVEFSVQSITDMKLYADDQFDLAVCSEVLEHIKEYEKEDLAIAEIKRITRPRGIIIIGTPNSELLGDHGFSFDEMDVLMKKNFSKYSIFENALVPYGSSRLLWERRLFEGRTGVVVTEAINLDETVLPDGVIPQLKSGRSAGIYCFGGVEVDTSLLHNTHSWAIVAINEPI